ncbi:uncharacterized protein LOC114520730 [Dendronephthya gigantea]|uniref:uncharacterized protein LOC114520730 n=1 Tax=Dendronephthya gigantea TaxID=151771 RepID=UPI00106B46C7|nr:uncharacterized protein LOC114520730 [Dendronephthya gigantea]XP_028396866.1 uncharacterized protein LOC114520730 [Dendronephthya gigantea]
MNERYVFQTPMKMKIAWLLFLSVCCTTTGYGKPTGDKFCETAKTYASPCSKDGNPGFCFEKKCYLAFNPTAQPFRIKIRYPERNEYAKNAFVDASKMFVRGSGLGLSWDEGRIMHKTQQDTWELRLEYAIPSNLDLVNGKKPPARFEFRVYLDDSKNMLGPNFLLNLPMSTNVKNTSKIPEFWEYPWFFNEKGTVERRTIYSPQLGEARSINVSLPPSFQENTYKKYETLFVNDGQRLGLLLPQLNILMVERALIKEVLVIGVVNSYANRTRLLAVSNGTDVHCINGTMQNRCNGCVSCRSSFCSYEQLVDDYRRCYRWLAMPKVNGQLYLDFIQDTLIPECESKYRSLAGPQNYGIMGFSLGGMISCHAIWTRPQTFGSAACMSPSLWWPFPENATFPDDAGYEFTRSTLMKHRGVRPRQKIYIDVGSNEGYVMISPARNASKILASTPYFELNTNLWFYIWDDEYHMFMQSVQRMWIPLIAFYGTEGSAQTEIERIVNVAVRKNISSMTLLSMLVLALACSIFV